MGSQVGSGIPTGAFFFFFDSHIDYSFETSSVIIETPDFDMAFFIISIWST